MPTISFFNKKYFNAMQLIMKYIMSLLIWVVVLVIAIAAVWFLFFSKMSAKPSPLVVTPSSDAITTQSLTHGNVLIANATARYGLIVPTTWYLEKKAGGGITLYPDYDPAKKIPPACKMEISALQNPGNADLDDWLTDYLHADPTADVVESSRMPSTVSGHPAVTWVGALNGVSTTLAYVSREDGLLYEIAPSVIQNVAAASGIVAGASSVAQCSAAFQSLMSSFRILP
jgi:hypothetical protein